MQICYICPTMSEDKNTNNILRRPLFVFGCVMCAVYFLGGMLVIASPLILAGQPSFVKYGLGVLLIVYATFRAFRLVQIYKESNEQMY